MIKKLPLDEFKDIYSKVPRLCVDLVIIGPEGILLTKRDIEPDLGKWHFPGGTVLMGETLKDTAERVAREELNVQVEVLNSLGFLEYTEGSGFGNPISAVFLVKPLSDKMKGGEQAKTIQYFTKLPDEVLPEVRRFIVSEFGLL